MEMNALTEHVKDLAMLRETESPVISCYLNLEKGRNHFRPVIEKRLNLLRKTIPAKQLEDFERAWDKIDLFIENGLFGESNGAAIFSRAGADPYFLPLQFRAPLPNWLSVDSIPNIYHLIELKDNLHRFVVVISLENSGRILEVNLGAVTESVWAERPELRQRVGREWTKEHYQNHRRDRSTKFVKEKIRLLEDLMSAGGHTHLILAGSPRMVAQLQSELPKHLLARVVDTVSIAARSSLSDIVEKTLQIFIDQEQRESFAAVERLQAEIKTDGLAVAGVEESLQALSFGQADMLIIDQDFANDTQREKMVRLAMQSGCHIETVPDNPILNRYGGVGCLLRYRI